MKPLRLFFALWPPEEVREWLWATLEPLRRARPGVRWIPPERYHVTLRFLGDTSRALLPSLKLAANVLAREEPFRVRITGTGVFPPRGAPRVYWVGLTPGAPTRLRQALDAALAREGFAPERRRFKPHLTVGRARAGGAQGVAEARGGAVPVAPGESFDVDALHLVRSELFPDGPRYANIHKVVLAGRQE